MHSKNFNAGILHDAVFQRLYLPPMIWLACHRKKCSMSMAVESFICTARKTDIGSNTDGDTIASWDVKGWVGTDEDKLHLKTEGEHKDGKLESAEIWALYSRNIATFWDAQAGIRYDFKPESTTYLTFGFNGLAPYWFETEAHLFISDKGDVSARLREENDFLILQKLILQPYAEVNLFAQDVSDQDVGAGLSDGKNRLADTLRIHPEVSRLMWMFTMARNSVKPYPSLKATARITMNWSGLSACGLCFNQTKRKLL